MDLHTLEPIMAGHPFFKGLPPEHLKVLVGCASNVRFDSGQQILKEGEEANQFFLIREGRVALEIDAPGREPITIQTLESGEILGWSWLVPPYYWMFTARAVTPTRAIAMDGKCLREKCEKDHSLGYELLKRLTHVMELRLQWTRLQLLDVYAPK